MFGLPNRFFRKRRRDKFAVSQLVKHSPVVEEENKTRPLQDKRDQYIHNLKKLRAAIVSDNDKMALFMQKYFTSQGFKTPKTLADCDTILKELNKWADIA